MSYRGLTLTGLTSLCRRLAGALAAVACAAFAFVAVPAAVAFATLALGATPAFAAVTHSFEGSFGPDGTAATSFETPGALGVDQSTGNLYVEDLVAGTVQKVNSAHEPEAFTGVAPNIVGGKLTGFSFYKEKAPINQLAVNSVSHDFYVVNFGTNSLRAYQADGEPADFTAGPDAGTNELSGFSLLSGVAIDANGDIYAVDLFGGTVQIYAPSGEHLITISTGGGGSVAIDSLGNIYLMYLESAVEKLVPSEFPVTTSTTYTSAGVVDSNGSWGVAVDPTTNHLYVDEHNQIAEYDEIGARVDSFGDEGSGALTASEGLAVNAASGQVYASDSESKRQVDVFGPAVLVPDVGTGKATEIHPTSATLNGAVNPDGVEVTGCHFDYGTSTIYGQTAACVESVGSGTGSVSVQADVTGLTPGTTYHFRLQASNANGANVGSDATFATPPPPAISGESADNLTMETADLNAMVNPGGLPVEACAFEYGTEAGVYPHSLECSPSAAQLGSGNAPVAITQHLAGLEHDHAYHWRVVATNEAGTTIGSDHTFVYGAAGAGLPDNRAYEMVTPPQKDGAFIGSLPLSAPPMIAEDGSRMIISQLQCYGDASSCFPLRGGIGTADSFTRTSGGWVAKALAPPATEFSTNSWWLYNADEGTALYSAPTPPAGEDDFYARNADGAFQDIGPLTQPEAGPDTEALKDRANRAATSDFSHIVWEEADASSSWNFSATTGSTLFEYSGRGNRTPALVGVSGGQGSSDLISVCNTALGVHTDDPGLRTMSADGRAVFFTAEKCESGTGANAGREVPVKEVFARVENGEPGAHTVAISQPKALSALAIDAACSTEQCQLDISEPVNWRDGGFVAASADGSKVFFLSTQRLTDQASQDPSVSDTASSCAQTEGPGGCNLYMYDSEGSAGRFLTDVSAGDTSGDGPRVQGVMAVSNDGSHVYFVAKGVLTGMANERGQTASDGSENLYVFEQDAQHPSGHIAFIASLPPSDEQQSLLSGTEWRNGPEVANVTPDGRFLVFTSRAALTAGMPPGEGPSQVFRYDAQTGELVRISIGERGFNDNGNGGVGNASIVWSRHGSATRAGMARTNLTMSNDGAYVFFMSPIALTPGALNDVQIATSERGEAEYAQNVYEYHDGHVSLISDGRDVTTTGINEYCGLYSNVCLIGTDASGSNVFFSTADQLVPSDTDTQVDYYDARICTSADPCIHEPAVPLPPCLGEACHGTPAGTPSLLGAPTATFNGQGNLTSQSSGGATPRSLTRTQKLARALKACRGKRERRKRAACERLVRRRYGSVHKAKRPSTIGKAGRNGRGK